MTLYNLPYIDYTVEDKNVFDALQQMRDYYCKNQEDGTFRNSCYWIAVNRIGRKYGLNFSDLKKHCTKVRFLDKERLGIEDNFKKPNDSNIKIPRCRRYGEPLGSYFSKSHEHVKQEGRSTDAMYIKRQLQSSPFMGHIMSLGSITTQIKLPVILSPMQSMIEDILSKSLKDSGITYEVLFTGE